MRGLTALLLLVSVAMCFALSKNEIEEFTEYLWKTSVLDQNLKDGTNFAHDEEEEVSDHAWEESGKFEGDLILNERQRRLIAEDVAEGLSRNGLRDSTKRWPNNEVIFYIQREHFSGDQVEAIKEGIDDLSRASCIKFRPYKKGDRDAVVIQGSRRGCFSQVGYQGGYQVLNLSGRHPVGRGCFRHGTVVHELLHTLGFYHMQSSHDRDEFIDVRWENIVQPARHNFRKYNAFSVSDFGVGYDYDSVLHYSRRAFSSNGGDTLVPKQSGAQIGQRVGLSDKDTQKLNKMYCDSDSNNSDTAAQQPSKPIKTKTTRNQPFQGHGIGYHQGKTLVIKVPVAETLKLPDSPSYAVFDYFSKASQALPPALVQGLGVGKEIAYRSPASKFNTKKHQQVGNNEPKITAKEKPNAAEEFFKSLAGSKDVERKPTTNKSKHNDIPHKGESKVNEELLEAFERLGKIIRTHVYPSSKPDTTTYNFNKDYSKFYNPESKKHESKAKKIDEIFSHRPKKPEKIETKEKLSGDADKEEHKHNDTSNVKDTAFISPLYNKIYGEVDSSFGTSLPFKKPVKETFKLSSKYSEPADENEFAHVKNYDDYSHLYKPKTKSLRSESEKPYYTLFGDPVPLKENWYRENYKKPKYDSSEKELGQYGKKVMKNSKSEREAKEKYEKYIKDKDVLSIPYENKYSSKEDLPSIEHSYEENSEEKQYDKFGHVGNSKIQGKKKDSSEHNSEYRYPELAKLYKYDFSSGEEEYDYNEKLGTSNPSNSSNEDHIGTKTSKRPVDNKYTKHGTSEEDELEKDAEDDNEKDKPTLLPRKSHTLNYRVTEEPEEKDHEMPAKESHDGTKSVEDYSSFGGDMDDRLSTILKNYDSIDDFDIELPYHSRQESSESAEHAVRLTDSNHASTTETTKYRHDNNPVN